MDCTCLISPRDQHVSHGLWLFIPQFENPYLLKNQISNFLAVFSISLFKVLTVIAFPVALAKSGISLLHAYVAAQNMSIIDQNEREEARKRNAAKKPE